ncbi:HEXXH motif domain-containing protein [Streptomyces sp. NPDC000410]|uniref:HEXXH motif domain-containing protein n=1 Tax=Streptomyces sp. NPDC000410 TaxID=3154254 RepID=UPI003330E38B
MSPDMPSVSGGPKHSLTLRQFQQLARGGGDRDALEALQRAERSHRTLLLDLLMDLLTPLGRVTAPLPAAERAWDLLAGAQRHDPAVVDELLLLPETGLWLGRLLERLRSAPRGRTPLWADAGHLHILAAVAAARAGLDFSFPVPVHAGEVWLPTLGRARLPCGPPFDVAEVTARQGGIAVVSHSGTVRLPRPAWRPASGWLPLRRVAANGDTVSSDRASGDTANGDASGGSCAGPDGGITLDDLGPYRIAPPPFGVPARLTGPDADHWSGLVRDALGMLRETDAPTAAAVGTLLRTIQPMPAHEPFRVRSTTSSQGVGGFAVSRPPSAEACAAAVTHELQHSKLSALIHLSPLHLPERDAGGRLYYAPWRDDPRPLGGMVQGAYAFTGVARFWRGRALRPGGRRDVLAWFEWELWQRQLTYVLPRLAADPALTEVGRGVLAELRSTVAAWEDRLRSSPAAGPAAEMALDHRTRWRLSHVRPSPDHVERLADAWTRGEDHAPALPCGERYAVGDSGQRHLDTRAVLVRIGLTDPSALRRMRADENGSPPSVTGACRADLLWATGQYERAVRAYADRITAAPTVPAAAPDWSGLRLALVGAEAAPDAVRALETAPELVAAVHHHIRRTTPAARPPGPVALAEWLGVSS